LNKNIEINQFDDRAFALPIAFNDTTLLESIYISNSELSSALNNFGKAIDVQGNSFEPSLRQSMIGYSIDDLVQLFNPPFPNHIKIDVDGNENLILKGASLTLKDNRVKSVLVELNSERDYYNEAIEYLENAGFECKMKHPTAAQDDEFSHIFNHIFIRD